jgi:hypothetical protein
MTEQTQIKAQDLRIGNYIILCGVDYNHDNIFPDPEMDEIIEVSAGTIADVEKNGAYTVPFYKPIPITPELLEKAGFRYGNNILHDQSVLEGFRGGKHNKYIISKVNNGFALSSYFASAFNVIHTDLKYLHQLQNLYFSLTGEELQINL